MSYIKARVDYDDETKTYYTELFEEISYLPEIETTQKYNEEVVKIEKVKTDCEDYSQNAKYDFYRIIKIDYEDYNKEKLEDNEIDIEDYTYGELVAVLNDEEEEEIYE